MQKPRTQRSTIREDVAALRAAHDESMRSLAERLDGITARLDQINGNVHRHDTWIAGREPVCAASLDNLKALTNLVTEHTQYLAEQTGESKARARWGGAIDKVVNAVIGILGVWVGLRFHP